MRRGAASRSPVIPESDDQRTEDVDAPFDLFEVDEDAGRSARVGSLLGAIGQIVAAVLVVVLLVALFIGGAVAFRWIFG
jgi:hypothetical protein